MTEAEQADGNFIQLLGVHELIHGHRELGHRMNCNGSRQIFVLSNGVEMT